MAPARRGVQSRRFLRKSLRRTRLQPRVATARFRRLPEFLIVGAQRCGTTSLYGYLAAHPDVAAPLVKEVQFFTDNFDRGESWYRAHFPLGAGVAFDATPYYLFHPLAAARAKAVVPDANVIALVRNPVDRAYSHYRHSVEQGHESLPFAEALDAEDARVRPEAERLAGDPSYRSTAHRVFSYVSRGEYASQLERWLERFGDRVLVVRSEDLYAEPAPVYDDVVRFLGLPPREKPPFVIHGRATRAADGMAPDIRRRLVAHFRPHNARLAELLGRPMGWDE